MANSTDGDANACWSKSLENRGIRLRFTSIATGLLITAFLMMASPGMAQDNVLHVAFNELPPWKVLNEDGYPGGIDIQMLSMLAEEVGCRIEFLNYPFKRGLSMMEAGEVDLMVGVLRRPEREEFLHFITPAYKTTSDKAFFVRKDQKHTIKRYEDLRHLRIGTGLGSKYFPRFDADNLLDKRPAKTGELSFKMLQAGRIDTVIMTESTGEYRLAKLGMDQDIVKADYAHRQQQNVYMVLSKKSVHAHRIDDFNRAMEKLVKAGSMKKIKAEFYRDLAQQ